MKTLTIPGFTNDTTPDDKPAMCVFGDGNTGKTRFGCTMPEPIAFICLDKNSKGTIDDWKKAYGTQILVPEKPFVGDKKAIELAVKDATVAKDRDLIKKAYTDIVAQIFEYGMKAAAHPSIASVAVDTSQLFDYILFSYFGRRNQIESFMRGGANQDLIEFITALRYKNLCLMNRSQEIWKDTGEVDEQGRKKQAPSGVFKPDGYGKVGSYVTCVLELTAKHGKMGQPERDDQLDAKYRARVITCKGNTLLEGQDLGESGVKGERITWANVLAAISSSPTEEAADTL